MTWLRSRTIRAGFEPWRWEVASPMMSEKPRATNRGDVRKSRTGVTCTERLKTGAD
jgi:hypothetical protein